LGKGTRREKCISCGSTLSEDIVLIGDQYPSAVFLDENIPPPEDFSATSLNLSRCTNESCCLIQLSSEYNLQYVFDHYPYESGTTATMKKILKDVIDDALSVVSLSPNDVILDIGGNDGTMLGLVDLRVKARVNIDAASGVTQTVVSDNYHYIHSKFDSATYETLNLPNPKLITCVAMFYHLSDPLAFITEIERIMDKDTVWVLQMTYAGTMLEDNILDNILHEHVGYYSLKSLEYLLKQVGLKIANAKIVESYGGSIRAFIVKDTKHFPVEHLNRDVNTLASYENNNGTNTLAALIGFNSRAQLLRKSLRDLVSHISKVHGPLWGFGASTKGNMILQFIGATVEDVPVILDNSSKKVGTRTTGTLIPIVDEDLNMENLPEYLLILPYYYKETFVSIIRRSLEKGRSVSLVIPLPYPHIIHVQSEA
jgi:NDP-4-keto-2,6-dideoxyhexose 3-C-methyltransferase